MKSTLARWFDSDVGYSFHYIAHGHAGCGDCAGLPVLFDLCRMGGTTQPV